MEAEREAGFLLPLPDKMHRCTMKAVDRVNEEIKRHTRVTSIFRNPVSLPRPVTAFHPEILSACAASAIYRNTPLTESAAIS